MQVYINPEANLVKFCRYKKSGKAKHGKPARFEVVDYEMLKSLLASLA